MGVAEWDSETNLPCKIAKSGQKQGKTGRFWSKAGRCLVDFKITNHNMLWFLSGACLYIDFVSNLPYKEKNYYGDLKKDGKLVTKVFKYLKRIE